MGRGHQITLIVSTILGSWLGMQAVHELGHILGAWASGADVAKVVLSPTTISRTDVVNNSHPLVVAWAGPIIGTTFPLLIWCGSQMWHLPSAFIWRFFAGFCLIANGLYIGIGSINRVGDCGELLKHGAAAWQLWLFGALIVPLGLILWHRQGSCFGLGSARGQVSKRVTYFTLAACLFVLMIALLVGGLVTAPLPLALRIPHWMALSEQMAI